NGISAVLSEIPWEEFCGPSAESNLQDLSWVGLRACRHEWVIEQVMHKAPVLPAQFGTIFSSMDSLNRLLERNSAAIEQFLDYVANKEEWSVKVLLDKAKAREERLSAAFSRESGRLSAMQPGQRYFQEQRIRVDIEKELNNWLKEVCARIAGDLNLCASDYYERKLHSREVNGKTGEFIINWAFLVPRSSIRTFKEQVDRMNADYLSDGLAFELSGPWPPYSFSPAVKNESQ
ncbi:MAG: GvpL/GvpF family gas vesicle protein, partial [Calditrichota bacterium]